MIRGEINEIKKQFQKDSNVITAFAGCYVDGEKNIKVLTQDSFYALPEEDSFKYQEIFRKTLSGTLGKSLLSLEFPLHAEGEGTAHEKLLALRESRLKDGVALQDFFRRIIDSFQYPENYYIIAADLMYDIPGKAKDRMVMEDASQEVYHGILVSICPVSLSKAALSYKASQGIISNRERDWVVGAPMNGFLFPAFNDRTTDIHSFLYFSKKSEELKAEFMEEIFGIEAPMAAGEQRETMQAILQDVLREELNVEVLSSFSEHVSRLIEDHQAANDTPLILSKPDMLRLIAKSGVSNEGVEAYERSQDTEILVLAENIVDPKRFEVKAPGITVKADSEHISHLKTKMVEGRKCLVIEIDDDVEVNGMPVKTM